MTNHDELKRLAEAFPADLDWDGNTEPFFNGPSGESLGGGATGFYSVYGKPFRLEGEDYDYDGPTYVEACHADFAKFMVAARAGVLALIAENERLRKERDARYPFKPFHEPSIGFTGCVICGVYTDHGGLPCPKTRATSYAVVGQEMIWCACGDGYPVNSHGAGFMDANNGVCANCDSANQGAEPVLDAPNSLAVLRKDAERYEWICANACDLNFYASGPAPIRGRVEIDAEQYPVSEWGSAKPELDSIIDAAMSKGEKP